MISVIVPIYNCARFLSRTFSCLEAQTNQDFELILINDASTDNFEPLLHNFMGRAPFPVQYIALPQHRGASAARNCGLACAQGDLICFIDADDLVAPNFLDMFQQKYFQTHYDLCFCNYYILDERSGTHNLRTAPNDFSSPKSETIRRHYLRGQTLICHCAAMYRREFLKEKGIIYIEDCKCAEDTEFACKVLFSAKRISFISRELYTYMRHEPSISHSPPDERVLTAYDAMRRAQKFLPARWRPLFFATKRARIHGFILDWFLRSELPVPWQYCSMAEMLLGLTLSSLFARDPREHRRALHALITGKIRFDNI